MLHRTRRTKPAFITLMLLAPFVAASAKETVIMDNGDRLNGRVLNMSNGILEFETAYAGKLRIEWPHVREIRSDSSFDVLLKGNEIAAVKELKQENGEVVLDSRIEPAGHVLKLNPAAWELGKSSWFSGEIDAAFKLERGNTHENRSDVMGKLEWKKAHHRIRLGGELEYGRTDGTVNSDRWSIETSYDTTDARRLYYGARTSLKSDELGDLNLRWTAGPHVGYRFIDTSRSRLSVESGLEYTAEHYRMVQVDRFIAESWRIEFTRFLIPDRLELYHRDNGLVSLGGVGGFSFESWNGVKLPISGGLNTSAEIKTSYNGDAPPDAMKWDVVYRLKIGYQW